jgi:hypothetical protein
MDETPDRKRRFPGRPRAMKPPTDDDVLVTLPPGRPDGAVASLPAMSTATPVALSDMPSTDTARYVGEMRGRWVRSIEAQAEALQARGDHHGAAAVLMKLYELTAGVESVRGPETEGDDMSRLSDEELRKILEKGGGS